MTQFYQELLTVRRDHNEVFLLPAPEDLVGREFAELGAMFMKYRNDRRSCLLIGIQRGDEMMINPIGEEAGPSAAERPAYSLEPDISGWLAAPAD